MLKIDEIKINGIRGFKYIQDEYENPKPHIIKISHKHLFLYGENGSGKSSFCDAIEWGLTGNLTESENRRINGKGLLINKFCPENKNPFIEITYSGGNSKKKFTRSAKGKNIAFDYEEEAQACLIESTRIERFVVDAKKNKWERFSELLGFENLIKFENKLIRLKNHSINKNLEIQQLFKKNQEEIINLRQELKRLERIFNEKFGDNWLDTIGNQGQMNEVERYSNLKDLIINIDKFLDKHKKIKDIECTIASLKRELDNEKSKTPTSEISRIVEESFNYFKNFKDQKFCPICGSEIEFTETFNRVSLLRESFAKILLCENGLQMQHQEIEINERNLIDLEKNIRYLYQNLYNAKMSENFSKDEFIDYLIQKRFVIEIEKKRLEMINSQNTQIIHYNEMKKTLSDKTSLLEGIKKDMEVSENALRDISSFSELYINTYSSIIKEELESICDDITAVYNAINKSNDEIVEKFSIEPNIHEKEIDFLINMKGSSDKHPALDILSTGHIRCLGFALLIARIKIKVENLGFIIIDDPIYSIDHEHRYNLIQYLKDLGNKYQLIITSSDRLFSELIRNNFDRDKFVFYKTKIKHEEGIIYFKLIDKSKYKNYISEAKQHLRVKDFRAASLYARLALETIIFDVARRQKLMIPFDRIEKHSIKDIMQNGLLLSLIENYPDHEEEIRNEFNELARPRYFKTFLDGFPLDQEVHYPNENRLTYCQQEIEEALDRIKHFNDFIVSLYRN